MANRNLTSAQMADLLRQQRQYNNQIENAKRIEEEQKIKNKKNNASIWEKLGDTLLDFGANFVGGASKAIEGLVDAGSAVAGTVAGWFGADDFKQQMQENIAYDWTGNNILNPADKITDTSLLNEGKLGQYIEGMASGVGQLLPTVAVSFIPGGAGLSKVMLFGSAMGNSTEQAVSEGADLGTASFYGTLSGGVELLSERISGKLFGAGKIDRALGFKENLGRSLFKSAKSGLGRMAQEAVGEGLEEAFAEAVNPLLKKWTYDPDAKGATFSEVCDSFVVGALTSIAFGGTVGQLPTYKNASRISRIQDQVNEYNDAVDKLYQDSANGKLNAEERQARQEELAKRKVIIEENISSIMQEFDKGWNITQKNRQAGKQEAVKRINASGNLKMGLNSEGKLVNIQDKANPNNSPYNVLASAEKANKVAQTKDFMKGANIEAISSNMSGQEHLIQYKPTSNPLTTEMKTALKTFADFSKAKGQNQRFVVVDKNDSQFKGARGLIVDDTGVIYLREDLSANDVINNLAQVTAIHEFSHGLENTGAYQELTKFVFNNLAKNAELAKQFSIENFEADYKRIATLYATNENTRDAFNRKSAKEQREYIQSEYMAKFLSEKAFTDSKTIKSLCRTNQSLGQKILNWLKDFVDRLKSVNKVERQMKVFLQRARNLYSSAMQEAGDLQVGKNIAYALNDQNLDKESDVKYDLIDEIEKYYDSTDYDRKIKAIDSRIETTKKLISYLTMNNQDEGVKNNIKELRGLENEKERRRFEQDFQRERANTSTSRPRWKDFFTTREFVQCLQEKDPAKFSNNKTFRQDFREIVDFNKLYTVNGTRDVSYKCLKEKFIPNCLKPIIKEDKLFGIDVRFYTDTEGMYAPTGVHFDGSNIIMISLNEDAGDVIKNHKHEKYHYFCDVAKNTTNYFSNKVLNLLTFDEKNNLWNEYFKKYKKPYKLTEQDRKQMTHWRVWEEIYAQLYSGGAIIKNQEKLNEEISQLDSSLKRIYNIRQSKKINFSLEEKSPNNFYGEGDSIDSTNTKDYNLVDVQDKKQFKNLLSNLVRQIKSGVEMKTGANMNLRHGLFNCLQNQKNNIYSKLAEINTAYEKTVSAYNKNNSINIPQTFIQALGYNGVIDGKDSVVYDLNNKKKNLLDYSEDRAKERLDRAIRLFGETDNPAKAGWLLADGRFVDYHRDSANIFTGNILDYEDHWQIEKVFDTRRGTDAIDAFMAEGNIRLMPEAGGIELRGKPNKNQIDKLEDFINKVIDKEGITLDLRPAGTTENHKPNPVSYDSTASAKEIMQDINSYYNTGKIAKVVDGVKFSLDEDIDTMLNDWWDNLSLEDLNEMIQDELKDFDTKEEVKLSKEERRELYVKKLYEEGKLNSVVTKLVNKNPQMKEYFKDTQMNMKYNPLSMLRTKGDEYIVMFHGTPNKYFNEFSPSFIGDNGSVMGEGFYFTESLEYANDYKQRDGRVISSLLDIKKPLSRNKVTVTKDELKTFIQDVLVKHKKNYLENFNNDIDFTVDYWMNHYDNDIDLIQGMHEHSVMLWEDFYGGLRDSIGYDGVIAWNKAEGTQAIVFNSNQIKDIFNRKPTKSADIRYALEEDSDGNKLSEAQAEFFKDSKVRDENGNLLVVYHGTLAKELNKFDKDMIGSRYSFDDEGFFFIDRKSIAESYSRSEFNADRQGLVIPVYILGKKPLIVNKDYLRNNGYPRDALTENDAIGFWDAFAGAILDDFHDTKSDSIVIDDGMSKMVVAFEPNQIKRIDNKNPTKSEDIRYSLIESDGKELVALHNLSEEKLRNSIALGGLPVPSIAITKAEFGHSNFGDITLVLKPDAINPADLRNKVFGADAYSKRFPKTVNKLKEGTEEALIEKFKSSAELIGDDVKNLGTYIETDSIDNIVDKLANKDYVKVQYLKDNGIGFEPIYTEYKLDENLEKNSITKKIVKMLIKEFPEEVNNPGLATWDYVTKFILPKIAEMKYNHYANMPLETDNPNERNAYIGLAEKFKENTTFTEVDNYLRKAREYIKNNGKPVIAFRATEEKLREAVKGKRKDIENYLREILSEYDEGMYYRNDRNIFDSYGNRRDFEQIYNKVTLASIVNYMSGTVQNTEGWGYGVGNVRSLLAKQYKTLEDIRADKDKIISPDEMDTLKKQSQDLYFELCYEVAPGDPDAGDEIIKEISEKPYNEKSILRVLKQYDSAIEDPEVIEHIIEFLDQLKDYPTEYFEAKPQRAVMFDEVAKLIAPQTTSNDIIDFFKKKGVEIALYEYDDDDSNRRNIIKNLPGDMRFSIYDDFDISDYYIPSDDGIFNAKNPKLKGQERDTEAIKYRAKLKQNKVFSREELEKVIDDAINQKQNIRLTGKRRETAIGELFKRMNTQDVYEKRKTAQDIANFIINNVFYDEIYTDTYEQQVAEFEMIDYYKGHFELNNQIKQELEYRTENGARIVNAWKEKGVNKSSDGTTKAKPGVNPHDVAQDLNDNGLKIDMDKSETEIFLDIYDRYNALDEAIKEFKAQQKELAINKLESSTMKSYRDDLIETILRAYDEKGSKTPYAKLKETYQTNLQNIKAELKDVKKYANAYVNYLVSNKRAKELVKGNKHYSAGVLEDPTLKGFLKAIAQTGNIKTIKRTARARIQKLAEVYNTSKKGSLFNDILGQEQEMTEIFGVKDSVYDENIANMIEYIAQGQGELTTDEIILLTKITDGLIHLYTTYDKVFKNGKYVETEKLAKDYGEKMRVGIDVRNKSKFLKGMWRFRAMFDPHAVMRNLDGYRCEYNEELGVIEDRGFFTEMFQEITDGEVKANVAELELLKPFGDFFKSHKGFERDLTKGKIKLNGTQIKTNGVKVKTEVEMSVGEAISIYLTSLRPQSNFYDSSVILQNKDKTTSEYSFDVKQINELFGKFTEAQKQYIKLVQKFFNEDAQKLKVETDLATLGYTNIEDSGVYFPINREKSAIAKNLGDTQVILDAINTYTLSFNKDVKPGAKLPIRISNVYGIVQNHARGMGAYYGLSVPLKTFNRVFNKQIESMGKQSLKRIASSQMYDSVAYIDKLLKDIQGRQYDNTVGGKALRWMRGNYAKFQLGFNPKTILGQTSSYMMASTYLDADALSKGLVMKTNTEQMFKYAPFTRYRMQEKTIVKAQGVIDKVGTWTDTFTKGIEWMDNNVVKKLWNASQVQIEKNTGHKIGTEENLNRASKLLEKVVRETQSNSIASEMTSLARSENEVLASLTMFSSDSQKQVSRLVDGLGLLSARKQWIANGTIKADDKIAKVAKKQIFRAGAGYVTATTMFVLIGMMMKNLLGKNDEDETITEEFFGDFKTQVAGLLPIYRDVYGFMNDGYELDNYAYGMINDALQGAKSMKNLSEDIISGKQLSKSEIGMPLRRSIYSLAQLFGVPVRNVWNYGYGIVNQFSPATAYRMNSLFYDAKLTDLDKSIQSGSDAKSIAIIKEIFESKNLKIDSNYTREVLELYKEGVNVIPGEIKETFTYNGEEITLTSSQHKQLLDAVNKVLTNFNNVVKQAEYKKLSATQKRTYLNNLYDINYILNVAKIVGLNNMKDSDIKKFLFASVLGNDLISYMAYIKTFESDKDKEGNTITNSKKSKIQNWVKRLKLTPAEKYLLMGFAGYKNINGESTVNVYLRRKGLSKDERELVLKWCGY